MKKDDLNKYISTLMNMDEKKLYGVLAGVLVLIFLADYFIIMRPQLNALSTINADMEVKRQEIQKAKENIGKLEQYQEQVDDLQKTLDEMNASVKPIDEISLILEQISNIADDQNVKLDQLNPNPQEQELLLENNKVAYYAFPILIEARTQYHDFGRFLNALENANLCLRIKDLSISSMDRSQYHAVTLSMNAIVFQEKIPSEE
jgi:Tfp pilus assembly protein PilO